MRQHPTATHISDTLEEAAVILASGILRARRRTVSTTGIDIPRYESIVDSKEAAR